MSWTVDVKPGQVLKITKMVGDHGDELALGDDNVAWGIVLDDVSMMVFCKVSQLGYPGAKGEMIWTSRVYPTDWADEDSERPEADEVAPDVPREFWAISAQAGLNGGV